jgi:hypothetical protein
MQANSCQNQVFLAVQVFLGSSKYHMVHTVSFQRIANSCSIAVCQCHNALQVPQGTYGELSTHCKLMLPLQYQCHNATLPQVCHGITIPSSLSQVRHHVTIAVLRQCHNAMLPGVCYGIAIAGSFSQVCHQNAIAVSPSTPHCHTATPPRRHFI